MCSVCLSEADVSSNEVSGRLQVVSSLRIFSLRVKMSRSSLHQKEVVAFSQLDQHPFIRKEGLGNPAELIFAAASARRA